MKILVIGSSNTDMIIKVPRIPKPGETILGGTFHTAAGGKGANQAVAASRAGGQVTFLARVGQDMFGEQAITGFRKDGIDTQFIIQDASAPSGVAEIFVAESGENSIAVASGANANLSPVDVKGIETIIQQADIMVLQLESPLPTVHKAVELAYTHNIPVILNPAPAQSLPDEILQKITILTPNETEAELLTGIAVTDEKSCKKAAEYLRNKNIPVVIITRGHKGVFVLSNDVDDFFTAFPAHAVDTTAAGDIFNGALAVAMAQRLPLIKAVEFAQAASAISVGKMGAQPSAPTLAEILQCIQN